MNNYFNEFRKMEEKSKFGCNYKNRCKSKLKQKVMINLKELTNGLP